MIINACVVIYVLNIQQQDHEYRRLFNKWRTTLMFNTCNTLTNAFAMYCTCKDIFKIYSGGYISENIFWEIYSWIHFVCPIKVHFSIYSKIYQRIVSLNAFWNAFFNMFKNILREYIQIIYSMIYFMLRGTKMRADQYTRI